jgi:peroxiredoxin
MKRIFTIVIAALLLFSCREETRTDYIIDGKAKGVYDGIRVFLKYSDEKGKEVTSDSAIVFEEKFKMTGKLDAPSMHFLTVNNTKGKALFMLENSEIEVVINKENLKVSTFTGSKTNDVFVLFQDGITKIQEEAIKTATTYRQTTRAEGDAKKDSLIKAFTQLQERIKVYPLIFVKENNDADFSLNLIGAEINNPKIDIAGFMEAYKNLSRRLIETKKGKEVGQKLDERYKAFKKTENLNIGKVAPNFKAPKPDGNLVSLNDIKGKVTIIDFWAAWCGPCRKENPNVVRVYEKYHDQGLKIIGVSLDGQSRQKDPKKAWLDAIEKDKLSWTQVSNLNYFNDPVAKLYNINAIPATFILDKDGIIVAKNLRGQALDLKVQELLAQ